MVGRILAVTRNIINKICLKLIEIVVVVGNRGVRVTVPAPPAEPVHPDECDPEFVILSSSGISLPHGSKPVVINSYAARPSLLMDLIHQSQDRPLQSNPVLIRGTIVFYLTFGAIRAVTVFTKARFWPPARAPVAAARPPGPAGPGARAV